MLHRRNDQVCMEPADAKPLGRPEQRKALGVTQDSVFQLTCDEIGKAIDNVWTGTGGIRIVPALTNRRNAFCTRGRRSMTAGKVAEQPVQPSRLVAIESPQAASLLYKVVDARSEQRSTALVTNIDFEAWGEYLGDPPLAMALLDRIVDGAIILKIAGKSYRAHRAKPGKAAPDQPR